MKWPTVKIDAIKAATRYSLVGGPFGSNLTTRDYVEQGVPVIRGSNLPDDREFSTDDCVFVSAEKANALQSNTAYPGDLVFTQRGTLGQIGLIPMNSPFPRYIISQSQMKLTVDESKADARFVYYFFRSPATVQHILNHVSSSGVPHINLGVLKETEIPLPPIEVQRRIAETLTGYDELLANNSRRMALLEEAARRLYREWFIHLRAPGLRRTAGGLPRGWTQQALAQIAEVNARTLPGKHEGEIEYVDISAVTPGVIHETSRVRFADAPSRARRIVRDGDIIWSCVRPNRRSHALILNPPENLIVSTGFAVLTPHAVPSSYLYHATTTDEFAGYLENRARGAAYPAVTARDFEEAEIVVPPRATLDAFDEVVAPVFRQRHVLHRQNAALRAARDLLLPRLMSGELEIPAKWLAA